METLEEKPGPEHPIALEAPATIAVLGGGPIGLEAALYGRFLGYQVTLFEQGQVAEHVLEWGHLPMLTPFDLVHSRLGRSAIETQNPEHSWPAASQCLTGQQWRQTYLLPLAETDLLRPVIQTGCRVHSVTRCRYRRQQNVEPIRRWQDGFTIVWSDPEGREQVETFDFVLDATGTLQQGQGWGPGGGPAQGEERLRRQAAASPELQQALLLKVPQIDATAPRWQGRRTLLLGQGLSAAHSATGLDRLMAAQPKSNGLVIWSTDQPLPATGLYPTLADDPLSARASLLNRANRIAQQASCPSLESLESLASGAQPSGFHFLSNTILSAIDWDESRRVFSVELRQWQEIDWEAVPEDFEEPDEEVLRLEVDQVIAALGHRWDANLTRELRLDQCPRTEAPRRLALALSADSTDRLTFQPRDPSWVLTEEGRYFTLGTKSFGRHADFYYPVGLKQVRDVYRWIVGRSDLDLETSLR